MKLFAYRHAEVFIFGPSGIDIRFRLTMAEGMQKTRPDMSVEESGELMRAILPLHYGNKFPRLAVLLTLIFGTAFYFFLPSSFIATALYYREWTSNEALNYLLLILQWYVFYILISVLSVGVTIVLALFSYTKRITIADYPK